MGGVYQGLEGEPPINQSSLKSGEVYERNDINCDSIIRGIYLPLKIAPSTTTKLRPGPMEKYEERGNDEGKGRKVQEESGGDRTEGLQNEKKGREKRGAHTYRASLPLER
jgi:hypothetical protein